MKCIPLTFSAAHLFISAQVLTTLGEGKMFFTARFHPSDDKQNVIMGGCADKKIYQWDSDTGDLVQARSLSV